jgi:hypothetical protein
MPTIKTVTAIGSYSIQRSIMGRALCVSCLPRYRVRLVWPVRYPHLGAVIIHKGYRRLNMAPLYTAGSRNTFSSSPGDDGPSAQRVRVRARFHRGVGCSGAQGCVDDAERDQHCRQDITSINIPSSWSKPPRRSGKVLSCSSCANLTQFKNRWGASTSTVQMLCAKRRFTW